MNGVRDFLFSKMKRLFYNFFFTQSSGVILFSKLNLKNEAQCTKFLFFASTIIIYSIIKIISLIKGDLPWGTLRFGYPKFGG